MTVAPLEPAFPWEMCIYETKLFYCQIYLCMTSSAHIIVAPSGPALPWVQADTYEKLNKQTNN